MRALLSPHQASFRFLPPASRRSRPSSWRGLAAGILGLAVLSGAALAQTAQKPFTRDDLAQSGAAIEEKLKRDVSVSAGSEIGKLIAAGEAAHYAKQDVDAIFVAGTEGSLTLPQLQLARPRTRVPSPRSQPASEMVARP